MNLLLSLPPEAAAYYSAHAPLRHTGTLYCDSDPADRRLGSGGGTAWIAERFRAAHPEAAGESDIIVHAGGESRRCPAYAVQGKSMTPLPVLRWAVGETIDRTLLEAQLPLFRDILKATPGGRRTLIASGDALITNGGELPAVPDADVVCFGLWAEPRLAKNHGVFFISRSESPESGTLDFMLQKPSVEKMRSLSATHYSLIDVGIWVLSDRALNRLISKSKNPDGTYRFYDLYSEFGCALGAHASASDPDLADLSVAVVTLAKGRFHHFGTSRQLISSTCELQNLVADQRRIMHFGAKPNATLFVQNCVMQRRLAEENSNIWIENSFIGPRWELTECNVVTGVPENDWELRMPEGTCLDVASTADGTYIVRPYGFDDPMRGPVSDASTLFMGKPLHLWAEERGVEIGDCPTDIQQYPLFPEMKSVEDVGIVARWMISEPELEEGRRRWSEARRVSASEIMVLADIGRLQAQRDRFLKTDLGLLADNRRSIFYQLDLDDTARKFNRFGLEAPAPLSEDQSPARRMRNLMFRSRVLDLAGESGKADTDAAFTLMRDTILSTLDTSLSMPRLNVHRDQIVWGRSPVRIDFGGGWTDTPPYSLLNGGCVVNIAVELNGQQPLQVFIKPSEEHHIILRSIDLGASEVISDYGALRDYHRISSPFSLPKAALALAGFLPEFSAQPCDTLQEQLQRFGSGLELTLLSALPAGSGMGTSSILAATILGALSDFCGLPWTQHEICRRTLALEQLLTTGGGWQDQYGGVFPGIKLLQSEASFMQTPAVSWLPDNIFTDQQYQPCHLLYYTGLTRTAKGILAEIVKRMFLNSGQSLALLSEMKSHALNVADAIQHCDFERFGRLIGKTWGQNKLLDNGTCPPAVQAIIDRIDDLTYGYKLPGAGGGGYLYMVAKDPEAAARIRTRLTADAPKTARFVEMRPSAAGLRTSRS